MPNQRFKPTYLPPGICLSGKSRWARTRLKLGVGPMNSEAEIRLLLIDACHSSSAADARILEQLESPEFIAHLVRISVDADDHQGDAPMTAAAYLTMASPHYLAPYESELVSLLSTADGYAASVALVLGRMKSEAAKPLIVRMLAEWGPDKGLQEALSSYDLAQPADRCRNEKW